MASGSPVAGRSSDRNHSATPRSDDGAWMRVLAVSRNSPGRRMTLPGQGTIAGEVAASGTDAGSGLGSEAFCAAAGAVAISNTSRPAPIPAAFMAEP